MKKSAFIPIAAMLCAVFLFCKGDSSYYYGSLGDYVPVYMTRGELEKSVKYAENFRNIENPGKIYIHGDRIYINEKYRGVHVIDNSDQSNPRQEAFIIAPGCLDMAVKGDIIYLDNAVDFVAFDMTQGKVTQRITGFFPESKYSPDGYPAYRYDRPENTILVRWDKIENF